MKKSKINPSVTHKIKKVATRFLENVVGGKGKDKEQTDKINNDQLLADVDLDSVNNSSNLENSKADSKYNAIQGDQSNEKAAII